MPESPQNNGSIKNRLGIRIAFLMVIALIVILGSFLVGRYAITLTQLKSLLLSSCGLIPSDLPANVEMVFYRIRLPRIIAAFLAGGGLALAGSVYQGVFRNPMVSPDILGATAGAGFGAAIGILLSFNSLEVQLMSFVGGILAVALTYLICIAVSRNNNAILTLVLTGIVITALFQAGISLIKFTADPYSKLPAITFWLMGSLASITTKDIAVLAIPFTIGAIPLFLLRWRINLLSFPDEEAKAMGINTGSLRLIVILCSTLITASVVSVGGIIGWVGLIIPHLTRIFVGPDHKVLIPASVVLGGTYLLLVDDIARGIMATEIPLGILTAIIGAPFFIYLMYQGRNGWS